MSIFRQILLLVVLSCAIILVLSIKSEQLIEANNRSLRLTQILNSIRPLYLSLMKGDVVRVKNELAAQGYHIKLGAIMPIGAEILYSENGVFGGIVIWSRQSEYGLLLNYLDDFVLASISDTKTGIFETYSIHILLVAQLFVMLALYILLYFILRPIKQLTLGMRRFENGDYAVQIPLKNKKGNELHTLAESFNRMASKIATLLRSKELLLRSAGHELRTPITKGKLALEIMQETKEKLVLKACFDSLDALTDRLLTLEYLQSQPALKKDKFFAQTLVFEALVASMADESSIELQLEHDFSIIGDKEWLVVALKNLIDNALKYRVDETPVQVCIYADSKLCENCKDYICVKNKGEPLKDDFLIYSDPFVRGEKQHTPGYGLGLSIVQGILAIHQCRLQYRYIDGYHCLCIVNFNQEL